MTGRGPGFPAEDEVRDLVRRIVDATLEGDPAARARETTAAPAPDAAATNATPSPDRVAIAIGADHGGAVLKDRIGEMLTATGFAVRDCGTHGSEPVDYPDIAHAVARLVADGTCRWGIILDGAGIGSCMVANKVPGIRAALCHDLSSARNSREHNHANVLTLGARFIGRGSRDRDRARLARDRMGPGPSRGPGRQDHRGRTPLHGVGRVRIAR